MLKNAILILDDDSDDRMILKDSFEPHVESAVRFFDAGNSLLSYLESVDDMAALPRLIVTDLNMPRMNGFELIKRLKEHPKYEKIPVVILSTAGKKEVELACIRLGASAYYEKPNSYAAMRALAQKFISMALL